MNPEPSINKMRTSVLITTIFATIFAIIMLILFYKPGMISNVLARTSEVSNGLESSLMLPLLYVTEAAILTFIALFGCLLVIIKTR